MSIESLNLRTPFPFKKPSTPSGMPWKEGFATASVLVRWSSASETSVMSTRPAVLIVSIRAGARS